MTHYSSQTTVAHKSAVEMEVTFRIIWYRVNSPIHLMKMYHSSLMSFLTSAWNYPLMLPLFCQITLVPKQSLFHTLPSPPSTMTRKLSLILPQPNLQGEHQKPGESGVLPPSHQVSPLQFEVSLVPSLHHHQPGIGGSFSGHILITCEGWNHRPAVENQTHLGKWRKVKL